MKRSAAPKRKTPLTSHGARARANGIGVPKLRTHAISTATPAQRAKVKETGCIITGEVGSVTPAHVIPRSLTPAGQNDVRAVVGLRADLHRLYDTGELDLLPWLERSGRVELSFAVLRVGLMATLRRTTNHRWSPDGDMRGERY